MASDHKNINQRSPAPIVQFLLRRLDEARTCLAFFTRLPVLAGGYWSFGGTQDPTTAQHGQLFANSFWAAPLAGLVVGLAAIAGVNLIQALGIPALSTLIVLTVGAGITGGLHEDGLADLADACGGGDRQRRLAIMKDSRIGSFGVVALVLWFLAAYICLQSPSLNSELTMIVVWSALASRGLLPLGIRILPSATSKGLGHSARATSWFGALVAAGLVLIATVVWGLWLPLLWLVILQIATYALAWRLLGGATGDVFGAAQKMGELGGYAGFAALLAIGT